MRRGLIRSQLVLVAALAGLCLWTAVGAQAKTFSTSATLGFNPPDNFSGQVSSPYKPCKSGRLVTLYYHGPGSLDPPQMVEAAKTDKGGHYEINVIPAAQPGDYHVIVSKRLIHKQGRVTKCRQFVSPQQNF